MWTGKLAKILKETEDWEVVDKALRDADRYPAEALADALTRNGYPVSASTIRTQRRLNGVSK